MERAHKRFHRIDSCNWQNILYDQSSNSSTSNLLYPNNVRFMHSNCLTMTYCNVLIIIINKTASIISVKINYD